MTDPLTIIQGDALSSLRRLRDESVQCCITSPPYWSLRDYGLEPIVWDETVECEHVFVETRQYRDSPIRSGSEGVGFHDAQTTKDQRWRIHGTCSACGAWRGCLGLEPTPELYVSHMVQIFRELRRVMRPDCTLWVNLGDTYAGGGNAPATGDLKPKDLVGIPWMIAFALRADGWYLRSDIIWEKNNPMPESVTDRPTRSHEYVFLLSKSRRYYYDHKAIHEPVSLNTHSRGSNTGPKTVGINSRIYQDRDPSHPSTRKVRNNASYQAAVKGPVTSRNRRSVWTIATKPFPEAHFATFPPDLVVPCVLAGSKPGDVIIDPFGGSGTVGKVALERGRKAILIEPNRTYVEMIERRCGVNIGLPLSATA